MKIVSSLTKLIKTGLAILLLILCLTTDVAYARGGCFAASTNILTPDGYKPIEQLHQADRIVGYNPNTHQTEVERIGEVQVIHQSNQSIPSRS